MRLLLVDGNGLAHRIWWGSPHAVPERFLRAIGVAEQEHATTRTVVCWDYHGPTWRTAVLPKYKAHRPPKPLALRVALRECRKVDRAAIAHREAAGYEADDVIATLARAATRSSVMDNRVFILTDDKDLAQLVESRVVLVNSRDEVLYPDSIATKFGVPPCRIRHLISWCGDKVDGLPGVPGYGPKKAIPRALAGEIGNELTFELCGLARVPGVSL